MSFPDHLYLEYLDGRNWRVTRRFRFFIDATHKSIPKTVLKLGIVVPAGFETDFASIPRFFWRVLPPTGQYGKAAVVHDFLYRTRRVPRVTADRMFLLAMEELSVPKPVRLVMYYAVRVFGGFAYSGQVMPR